MTNFDALRADELAGFFISCPPESAHGSPHKQECTRRADVEHQWFRGVPARHDADATGESALNVAETSSRPLPRAFPSDLVMTRRVWR